jgi:hypothetical protein
MGVTDQVVGNLWVVLNLETGGLDSGVTKAQATLKSFGVEVDKDTLSMIKMGAQMAATAGAAALVINEMNKAAQAAARYGDELHDLSLTTLMTERSLQRLQYATNATGGDFNALAGSITFLGKNLENAKDPTSSQAEALKRLGINAVGAHGSIKDMDTLLPKIIDKLHNMRDSTERAHLMMQLFGKNTGEVAKLVELGSAGVAAYGDEAERLGLLLSPEQLAQQQAFNDAWAEMNTQINLLYIQLGTAFIPVMQEVTAVFGEWLPAISAAAAALSDLINLLVAAYEYKKLLSIDTYAEALTTGSLEPITSAASAGDAAMARVGTNSNSIVSSVKSTLSPSKQLYYSRHPDKAQAAGIPGYAEGGLITKPTLATFAENEPEYAIPMSKMGSIGGKTIVISPTYQIKTAIDMAQTRKILKANNRDIANKFNMLGA